MMILRPCFVLLSLSFLGCTTAFQAALPRSSWRIQHPAGTHRTSTELAAKKILICFDGTGNSAAAAESPDNEVTNVLKFHVLAGGSLDNSQKHALEGQNSFYYTGIGTRGSDLLRKLRYMLALMGPRVVMEEARKDLAAHYEPGDSLYIFGFSRGAATARLFASQLHTGGITLNSGETIDSPPIEFLGVWDTVADFGFPHWNRDALPSPRALREFNGKIAANIRQATHLLSLDDDRVMFFPTLMSQEDRVHEVWFPGTHSGVGGGWRKNGLSDGAGVYMMNRVTGLDDKNKRLNFMDATKVPPEALVNPEDGFQLTAKDIRLAPDIKAPIHEVAENEIPIMVSTRKVCVVQDNKPVEDATVLISDTVQQRMNTVAEYNPENFLDAKHVFV